MNNPSIQHYRQYYLYIFCFLTFFIYFLLHLDGRLPKNIDLHEQFQWDSFSPPDPVLTSLAQSADVAVQLV